MSWHREFWGWPAGSASHCLHPLPAEWLTEGEMLFAALHFWKKKRNQKNQNWVDNISAKASHCAEVSPEMSISWAGYGCWKGRKTSHLSPAAWNCWKCSVHFHHIFQAGLQREERKQSMCLHMCHCKAQQLLSLAYLKPAFSAKALSFLLKS